MEFLMTYGWAILVVLVAIGALAYFGVMKQKDVPQITLFGNKISSIGKAYVQSNGEVLVALQNNAGYKINITEIKTTEGDCVSITNMEVIINEEEKELPILLNNAESFRLKFTCTGILTNPKNRFKAYFQLKYLNPETGVPDAEIGKIISMIN